MFPLSIQLRDGQTLAIRQAKPTDASHLIDYLERVAGQSDFLSFGPGEFGRSEKQVSDNLTRFAASQNQMQLLAEYQQRLVGTLTFVAGDRPRTRHIGELGMSVDRSYWGMGIGGKLLDTLIDWACHNPIVTKINLRVAVTNGRAIELYESRSFKREGTISRDMLIDGRYVPHHLMGRFTDRDE